MASLSAVLLLAAALQTSARGLWSSKPAQYDNDNVITQAYPVGNGRLAGRFIDRFAKYRLTISAMPYGSPGTEVINLNIDSLWSGGPFGAEVKRFVTTNKIS